MAKRFIVFFILTAFVLTGAFASGQKEGAQTAVPQGAPPTATGEKLSLKGNVYFQNRFLPVLKVDGKEYDLMVPHRLSLNVDVSEGEQIAVEGYTVTGMPCASATEGDTDLFVTKATIKGKDYDLSLYGRGTMMGAWGGGDASPGWGRGMMGGNLRGAPRGGRF